MLQTLRWAKTSPALVWVMMFTGTRKSEQPIYSTVGFCPGAEVGEVVPVLLENLGDEAPVAVEQRPDHCPLQHSVLMAGIAAR